MTATPASRPPPSVDFLAGEAASAVPDLPHPLCVDAARAAIAAGDPNSANSRAQAISRALLRPVINATGVLLHTNLGRAPLAVTQAAAYHNLEFDLTTGSRGSRSGHAAHLLARATGAEAALVVNNGAAAVLLVLTALATGRPVVISRGELVEIGGGFRIPDVLTASGALLVEVGTTNRTRLTDYTAALSEQPLSEQPLSEQALSEQAVPALALKVHPSNYRLTGFTESTSVAELAAALASTNVPVVADLGSGLLDAACPWLEGGPPAWLAGEPAVRQTLEAGAALVTFSGDKLLGGPQAGIIAGRADLIATCAQHPLSRALRPGAMVLRALQQISLDYLRRDVTETVPFWRMATASVELLRARATGLAVGEVVDCGSVTGGGTLPGVEIPSAGVALVGDHSAALRASDPPVIARVIGGRTVCDLRTVDPIDDPVIAKALAACT